MTTSNALRETELLGPKPVDSELVLGFELHNVADLLVTQVVDATGIQTESVLGADYSLSIATGNQTTLTLTQALETGKRLRIRRISGPRNELSLETSTTLPLPATEDTFDRLAHYHADVLGELDRCVKLSDGEVPGADQGKIDTPDVRKGNFLKYDAVTSALTHDAVVVGSAGPQGIPGPATGIQSIQGTTGGSTTGNAVTIAGTGAISTSHAGDVITIVSSAGGLSGLTATGGTTTGSTVTLSGTGTTTTTRAGDVITISSTGVTGERALLDTSVSTSRSSSDFQSVDWPSSFRKIEVELIGLIPASAARFRMKAFDGATPYNTNCNFISETVMDAILPSPYPGPDTFESHAANAAFGNLLETNNGVPIVHASSAFTHDIGINGSVIFTHINGDLFSGHGSFIYVEGTTGKLCRFVVDCQQYISVGTLDGFRVEMRDHSVTANDTASVVTFTGIVKIWGHLN
jgi:hypothetical protein